MIVFIVFFFTTFEQSNSSLWLDICGSFVQHTQTLRVCVFENKGKETHEETALNLLGMRDKETETHMHRRDNLLRAAAGAHRCRLSRPIALWCLRKRERILLENFNIPLLHPSPPAVICF